MSRRLAQLGFFLAIISFATGAYGLTEAAPTLQPPHSELGPTFWEARGMILVLGNVAFFMLLGALYLVLQRPKKIVPEAPDITARRTLEALRSRTEDPQLLMEISRVLRRYAIFAYCLPPDEFTTTEMKFELQARPSANPVVSAEFIDFLRQCDQRKFSPAPAPGTASAVTRALELLEKIKAQRQPPVLTPLLQPGQVTTSAA